MDTGDFIVNVADKVTATVILISFIVLFLRGSIVTKSAKDEDLALLREHQAETARHLEQLCVLYRDQIVELKQELAETKKTFTNGLAALEAYTTTQDSFANLIRTITREEKHDQ